MVLRIIIQYFYHHFLSKKPKLEKKRKKKKELESQPLTHRSQHSSFKNSNKLLVKSFGASKSQRMAENQIPSSISLSTHDDSSSPTPPSPLRANRWPRFHDRRSHDQRRTARLHGRENHFPPTRSVLPGPHPEPESGASRRHRGEPRRRRPSGEG